MEKIALRVVALVAEDDIEVMTASSDCLYEIDFPRNQIESRQKQCGHNLLFCLLE